MSSTQGLRDTFNQAAALYYDARPDYPEELYDDLVELAQLGRDDRLLEVGCGPGKATLPLARMGYAITAVELGAALADEARRRVAAFPAVRVVTSGFEEWADAHPAERFGLVYAATAWHWVDPEVRYAKASALLKEGGHLAVWAAGHAFPADYDPFFREIQEVYDEIGESRPGEWPPTPPEAEPGAAGEFEESGLFEVVGLRRYLWARRYTTEEYLRLLDTFSGHIAMKQSKRNHLYVEIRRRIADRPDGQVVRHWSSVLTVGRRC